MKSYTAKQHEAFVKALRKELLQKKKKLTRRRSPPKYDFDDHWANLDDLEDDYDGTLGSPDDLDHILEIQEELEKKFNELFGEEDNEDFN